MNQSIASELITIFNIPLEEKWNEYLNRNSSDYYQYFEDLEITVPFDSSYDNIRFSTRHPGMTAFLRKISSYFEVSRLKNKHVADVGCGWGFLSFFFLLNGASRVYALGFPYQIEFISRLYKAALVRNLIPANAELIPVAKPIKQGDTSLGYKIFNELDYVMFHDVFEHIHDEIFEDALKASYNSLKKGGKIISATHNTDNPVVLQRTKVYWQRNEKEVLRDYRKKMILQQIPKIDATDCDKLADGTQGLTLRYFNQAITDYKEKKILPPATDLKPAVDLTYDYVLENVISPKKILFQMKNAGFRNCLCYPQLRHSRRFMPFWPFEKIMAGMLMKFDSLSQAVIFYGEKS